MCYCFAVNAKERYEKPILEIIELKAEEVLGVGCKSAASSNVGQPLCGSGLCNQLGS